MNKKKLVVLTGAGISAESGLKTFRDGDGLWENHSVYDVATPEAWIKDPELVLKFYTERWIQVKNAQPNLAHKKLAALETEFDIDIITQNIDDLHERAGSSSITHLHGEINKVCAENNPYQPINLPEVNKYISIGDTDENQIQLRPFVVWFGEQVPKMEEAVSVVCEADLLVIVGTSLQVYPAASLYQFCKPNTPIFVLDPSDFGNLHISNKVEHIQKTATQGIDLLIEKIKQC